LTNGTRAASQASRYWNEGSGNVRSNCASPVVFLLDRGIGRLVGVGGGANVLRSALQISTSLSFFSDGRGYKRSLCIFFCSLGCRTKIRASWVDSRIVEGGLSGVALPLVTPYLDKSSLMSPPLGDQTKSSL